MIAIPIWFFIFIYLLQEYANIVYLTLIDFKNQKGIFICCYSNCILWAISKVEVTRCLVHETSNSLYVDLISFDGKTILKMCGLTCIIWAKMCRPSAKLALLQILHPLNI